MSAALSVRGLEAGYNGGTAVRGLDIELAEGEILALLGPNGAGKTTSLLAIVGAIPVLGGSVYSFEQNLTGKRVEVIARSGVRLVPDDRGVFFDLTVAEHLLLARGDADRDTEAEVLDLFPQLRDLLKRRCGLLSGGEQQMLGLAKTLMSNPRVLLVDEMSLGLAPRLVKGLLPVMRRLATERGTALILVEQHIDLALGIADQAIVLNQGRARLKGPARALRTKRKDFEAAYFGTTDATYSSDPGSSVAGSPGKQQVEKGG